ncbi:ABC transporter ATP-binding protein [Bradyrhizobium sp. KB893862 SZCCT0404]|uniref:ABC transporter ATP-binding protein n=1 Tax=Bradyrhizobium sp. KB893862 SZCCT0404 TaxID=2807672 RepID=UPI001BAB0110|nr:ABC transporter ATP-binding protein [Bradyrhizobium sp. KB893862 SZCCT0404]
MTELAVESVRKTLGQQQVLKDASFSAEKGTVTALLGASGSGKSTLLRCIAGLERPESGRISIGGASVFDCDAHVSVPPERRQVGFVFQSYALWPHRTVQDNVAYGLRLRGVPALERQQKIDEILAQMDLAHLAQRYPAQLSGGQQQRVAICRALVYRPKILLLDEPLSNLDQKLRDEARYWIRKLILDLQICAILVTHDQNEALAVADNIMLLQEGAIVERGAPQALYANPRTFYAASFIGTSNVVEGRLERAADGSDVIVGDGFELPGILQGNAARKEDCMARAVIRSEEVCLVPEGSTDAVEMELVDSIFVGDRWEYRLAKGGLKLKAYGGRGLPHGSTMVRMPRNKVWIFA